MDRRAALDRSGPIPLWAQLADDLRRRARRGEFHERFPTDAELTADYGVSRHTAREAVRALRDEGLLERRQGRGTFLRPLVVEAPVGVPVGLFAAVEALGLEQKSEVLALDTRREPAAAHHLGLASDAELLYLERRRLAGPEPLALDRAWLPYSLAQPLLRVDFTRTALYHELQRHCGITVDAIRERVEAVVPGPSDRVLLEMPRDAACFVVQRLGLARGRPVEWRLTLVRGDRFALTATSSLAGPVAAGAHAGTVADPSVDDVIPPGV